MGTVFLLLWRWMSARNEVVAGDAVSSGGFYRDLTGRIKKISYILAANEGSKLDFLEWSRS